MNHSENFLVLLVIIFETIYSFGTLFLSCELPHRMNITFCECGDIVEHFKWYMFPVEVQQMVPMVLTFVQKPVVLKCFGSTTADRETFKKVSVVRTIVICKPFVCCIPNSIAFYRLLKLHFPTFQYFDNFSNKLNANFGTFSYFFCNILGSIVHTFQH